MLRARLLLVALLVAWLFSPPAWRYAVPLWLPFVLALGLELQFFVTGLVSPSEPTERGHAPQGSDLHEFGWEGEPPEEDDPEFWPSPPVPRRRRHGLARLLGPVLVLAAVALIVWAVSIRRGWSRTRLVDAGARRAHDHRRGAEDRGTSGHRRLRHLGPPRRRRAGGGRARGGRRDARVAHAGHLLPARARDRRPRRSPRPQTGHAIVVLAHESWHLRGVEDEGLANCYAYQSGVQVGVDLGLSRSVAYGLMRQALSDNAIDAGDPRYVVPAGCKDGGKDDLNPASSQFP